MAVANALTALKERADIVTQADHGAGVEEIIEQLLRDDLASFEQPDRLGRSRRDMVGEDRRAVCRRQPGGVEQVFDGELDPAAGRIRPREEDPGGLSRSAGRSEI